MAFVWRQEAEKLHKRFLAVLDQLSSVKMTRESFDVIEDLSRRMLPIIDQVAAANGKALDDAERYLRAMEAAYYSTPAQLRQSLSRLPKIETSATSSEFQQLLAALQPPTGWRKWRDLLIAGPAFTVIGSVGTLVVQRLLGI